MQNTPLDPNYYNQFGPALELNLPQTEAPQQQTAQNTTLGPNYNNQFVPALGLTLPLPETPRQQTAYEIVMMQTELQIIL
jgi:hypothetical protein